MFVEIRLFPDLECTESTMYLATRKTLSQHTAPSGEARSKYLLLEQFKADLPNDALQHPAGLLVECLNFFPKLSLSCALCWEVSLKNLAEELNPGRHLARLEQIRRDFNLIKKRE